MKNALRGIICGMLCPLLTNFVDIILLFHEYSVWLNLYFVLIFLLIFAIITFLMYPKTMLEYVVALIVFIVGNYISEQIIFHSEIYNFFYFIRYPTSSEIAIGESLITVLIWLSKLVGIICGFVFVFIRCLKSK